MVLDNLTQMDKSDASYGPEYETALKYAAATTLNGEVLTLKRTNEGRILLIIYTASADTVCTGSSGTDL